jgi:hypothetical protein
MTTIGRYSTICGGCSKPFHAHRPWAGYCSNACRQRRYRERQKKVPQSIVRGSNADLIAEAARLYVHPRHRIADLTYGQGVFWRKCSHLDVTGSDIMTCPERPYDFRSTPYDDASFDIAVLDPPYLHHPGKHVTDDRYQNAATTAGYDHDDIMQLYRDGMTEAKRIVRLNGQVWVKCKDQIQGGVQMYDHIVIGEMAQAMGLYRKDLLIIEPTSKTSANRWDTQLHIRKAHSYLWILEKCRVVAETLRLF